MAHFVQKRPKSSIHLSENLYQRSKTVQSQKCIFPLNKRLMLKPADNYFLQQEEPVKSCLLALRKLILSFDNNIIESWKYGREMWC